MKPRVLVLVGSKSDLPQLTDGLKLLQGSDAIEYLGLVVGSIHRNQSFVQCLAMITAGMGEDWQNRWDDLMSSEDNDLLLEIMDVVGYEPVDVVITAAGWANHLTGCFDAFLRHTMGANLPWVVGVAMEDHENPTHTQAARLAISEVPGTKVIYEHNGLQFVGSAGFTEACRYACTQNPYPDGVPEPDPANRKATAFYPPDAAPV